MAPTAANAQPQRIVAINTPEGMAKLACCARYTYGAPAAALVCYGRERVWVRNYDGKDSGDADASIVTTQTGSGRAEARSEAAEPGTGTWATTRRSRS